jgi:hypothetical protein
MSALTARSASKGGVCNHSASFAEPPRLQPDAERGRVCNSPWNPVSHAGKIITTNVRGTRRCSPNAQKIRLLLKTAKRIDMGQRMEMIGTLASMQPGRTRERAIRFLKEFLSDKEGRKGRPTDGPAAGFMHESIRVCDLATQQLAYILDLPDRTDSTWKEADWDKFRARVEAELAKRPSIQLPKGGK